MFATERCLSEKVYLFDTLRDNVCIGWVMVVRISTGSRGLTNRSNRVRLGFHLQDHIRGMRQELLTVEEVALADKQCEAGMTHKNQGEGIPTPMKSTKITPEFKNVGPTVVQRTSHDGVYHGGYPGTQEGR